MDRRYADNVVKVAEGEAQPAPYGKVNDNQRVYIDGKMTEERFGWENLKGYFDVAARFKEQHWRLPGYLDGVRLNNKRVPPGINWCGIFATWVWIKAGIPGVYWAMPGVKGPNVKLVAGNKGISRGDIGILTGDLVHHFIVKDVNDRNIVSINGNSMYQGITTKTNSINEVSYYYTIEDAFYNKLQTMYG